MAQQVQIVDEPLTATGTWMTPPQVNAMCQYQEGGLWLGRNGDNARSTIGHMDDSHVLLCAMNRSGKGRGLITNNLLLWKGSVFCNDPKGENASVCAARRGQGSEHTTNFLDQKVCVLDSHHTAKVDDRYRAYYNVLNDLDPNNEDSASLAEDIAESCITENVKKDPTWDDMAKPFMKFLLLHIITAPRSDDPAKGYIPDNERDLVTFRKMILSGDYNGLRFCEAHLGKEAVQQNEPDLFELLLSRMKTNPTFDGIISDYARSLEKDLTLQPKLWNSIRSAAVTATSWIDDQKMRKVLRAGTYPQTFSAREFKENPKGLSLFVCLRLKDQKKYAAWPRILSNMVLAAAQEDYHATPSTGHSTLMMLDEFASLERMKSIEDAIAGIAGAGVKIFMVLQNLTQAKATYGDNWEAFIANAGTQVYYGFNDNFTAEYVSKRLGEIEVIRKMRSGSKATMQGTTVSDTTGGSHTNQTSRGRTDQHGTSSSHGGNSSYQDSYGTGATVSNGWSPSLFHLSLITSLNRGRSSQKNSARGGGKTWQEAKQQSRSNTHTESESDTENWSRTVAQQRSETITEGWTESLFKRPLAAINDLIKLFGTVEDDNALNYPGIGLVLTSSSMLDPFMVVKCYYDRDPYFEGMFDPHPKHGIKIAQAVVTTPRNVEKKEPLQQLHVCLNVSEDAFRNHAYKDPRPRFEMRPRPTVSNPKAHGRYYHDSFIILPHGNLKVGSRFRKGDLIADFYYGILAIGWLEKRHHKHTLVAPADGRITAIHDFGWETTVNDETVPIKNNDELSEIQTARRAVDGRRISPVVRSKSQLEFVLEASPKNAVLTEFRDYASAYVETFYAEQQAEMELGYATDETSEFKALLPFSAAGLAALVYILFFVEGWAAVLYLAPLVFIGLVAFRVPEELLVGLVKLFNPWRLVVWAGHGFRIPHTKEEDEAKKKHQLASSRLLAAKRALNFPL